MEAFVMPLLRSVLIIFVMVTRHGVSGNEHIHPKPPLSTDIQPLSPPVKLASYRVHKDQITLSGFSSGGSFAQQLQFSYSSLFRGIAVFSHTYYNCGPGNGIEKDYDDACTTLGNLSPERLWDPNVVLAKIQRYAFQGLIENPNNLQGKKLYVYTGTQNFLFTTDQSLRVLNIYEPFIKNPSAIFTRVQVANLTLPSDNFGGPCALDSSANFFIANCGISGPYDALKFLLGDFIRKPDARRQVTLQPLLSFDQSEFFGNLNTSIGMDRQGFLYIPQYCRPGTNMCYLHFYFHGCTLGREFVSDNHIKRSGYLELAEENGIIMVFPQAKKSVPENEIGCWDTYGLNGPLFATQKGNQVTIVRNMLRRILTPSVVSRPSYGQKLNSFTSVGVPAQSRYYNSGHFHYPYNTQTVPQSQQRRTRQSEDRVSNIFSHSALQILAMMTPFLYLQ